MKRPKTSTRSFEHASTSTTKVLLRLYIAGSSDRSMRALTNAKQLCDEYFDARYELEVIDVFKQPAIAKEDEVLAVPTLIKRSPPPLRKIIGDLSDRERVMRGLDIVTKKP